MKLKHKIYEIADNQGSNKIDLEKDSDTRLVKDDIITEVLLTDAFKKVYFDTGELEGFSPLQYSSNANGEFIEDGNLVLDGQKIHLYVPSKDMHVFFTKVRNPAIIGPSVSVGTPYVLGVSRLLGIKNGEEVFGGDLSEEEKTALIAQQQADAEIAAQASNEVKTEENLTPAIDVETSEVGESAPTEESAQRTESTESTESTEATQNTETTENTETQAEQVAESGGSVSEGSADVPTSESVNTTEPIASEPVISETPVVAQQPVVVEPVAVITPPPVVEQHVAPVEATTPVEVIAPVLEEAPNTSEEVNEEKILNAKDYQDARRFFGKRGFEEHINGAFHFFYGDPIEDEDIYPFVLANRGGGIWEELDGGGYRRIPMN